jgi:hypothetical protein
MEDGDGWLGRSKRHARFNPKNLETLRPCMKPLIGHVFDFTYASHSDEDEVFPGQSRWLMDRKHDHEIDEEARGRWFPSEDLVDVSTESCPHSESLNPEATRLGSVDIPLFAMSCAPRDGTVFVAMNYLGYPVIVWGDERGFFDDHEGYLRDDLDYWFPIPRPTIPRPIR